MARKSKQPGGHNPLTAHERKKYAKNEYGTTKARLGQDSQYTFGNCGLSLYPAKDQVVASPSGHIYERSAMLEYLLTKTQELKRQRDEYDRTLAAQKANSEQEDEKKRKSRVEDFERTQKVASAKKQKAEENVLKRTSYWLADMQPDNDTTAAAAAHQTRTPPPNRPSSPNTQRPLRRKDLIALELRRKPTSGDNNNSNSNSNNGDPVLCAISEKEITTQQALALVTTTTTKGKDDETHPAQVVLEQVYKDLKIEKERKPTCPVTGRRIKQVLKLQRGGARLLRKTDAAWKQRNIDPP